MTSGTKFWEVQEAWPGLPRMNETCGHEVILKLLKHDGNVAKVVGHVENCEGDGAMGKCRGEELSCWTHGSQGWLAGGDN